MDQKTNKYIAVAYELYTVTDGEKELVEEAPAHHPFQFVSGFGYALEDFEKNVINLNAGDDFDFTLTKEQAYGDYEQERVLDLDREIFTINGHFDHENIVVGAMLPLQNEEGMRLYGKVLEITDSHVKVDLNHPLAGKDLNFKGSIVENREATDEEIKHTIKVLTGEGCGCGCGHDDCGCGHDHHDEGCGCGHCH
jgi:FKBP-type peptidyl-prolyl cis-trans isomerase SlyD